MLPQSKGNRTIVTVLQNYTKTFSCASKDVDDAGVEEGQPILYNHSIRDIAL